MAITSFTDLTVYQLAYRTALDIAQQFLPTLPIRECRSLADQIKRSSQAVPALIAEGYAKRHHPKHFQRYLNDALGECNELIVHLTFCRDLYVPVQRLALCKQLIAAYDTIGKQLYRLSQRWRSFTPTHSHFPPPTSKPTSHISLPTSQS
jgi:four helix bundle protein